MAELSDLYVNLLNQASDPMRGYRAMQDQQVRNMELQNKQREFAAEQQLRELFARNANPKISEIGAISPQFAQTFGKNQMEMMQAGMGMQNIESQINERVQKRDVDESRIRAFAFAPLAEQYKREVDTIGEAQARKNYNEGMGKTASALQAAGINIPMNFNPEQATPDAVLNTAVGFGFPSEFLKGKASLATKAAEQSIPQRHTTQEGYTMIVPGIPPQNMVAQPAEIPQGAQQMPLGDADDATLKQLYPTLPTGRLKDEIGKYLASKTQATMPAQPAAMPPAQFVTPQQIQKNRIDTAAAETAAKEEAKIEIEKKQDAKEKLSLIAALPSDLEVKDLLQKSIAGAPESIFKGPVATALHIENQAQNASTVLRSLAETVKNLATKAKGDLNQKELESYQAAMGDLANENLTPLARFAAYTSAKALLQKKLATDYPEIASKYQTPTPAAAPQMNAAQKALGADYNAGRFKGSDDDFKRQWDALRSK